MKTALGEYRKFCDALPPCYYFEECEDDFDDTTDDATPITLSGWLAWQGPESRDVGVVPGVISAKERDDIAFDGETISVAALFRRWRKAQSTVRLVVEVDKSKEVQLRALLAMVNAKIV